MKLTRSFFILLCILFILCVILYSIQKNFIQEGLTSDNPSSVAEVQVLENDRKFGTNSSYITILPLKNFVSSQNKTQGIAANYPDISRLPICNYAIKSSYNSACSGSSGNISNEMLKYVLSRGCRFVDFEIKNISGIPYVVSPNLNSVVTIDTTKIVPLSNILQTAITYGITNSPESAPNYADPLFLHLRIHPDPSYNNLYQDIASCIEKKIGSNLYNNKTIQIDVTKTKISDIMGKVIVVVDNNYDPNWRTASKCDPAKKNCYDLNNFVHIETGIGNVIINSPTTILNQSKKPIQTGQDGLSTMNQNLQFIFPDSDMAILNQTKGSNKSNKSNPDFTNLMLNWSCNFITNCFYIQDRNLRAYEDFFNEKQTAIVPLSDVKNYYTKQQFQ